MNEAMQLITESGPWAALNVILLLSLGTVARHYAKRAEERETYLLKEIKQHSEERKEFYRIMTQFADKYDIVDRRLDRMERKIDKHQ